MPVQKVILGLAVVVLIGGVGGGGLAQDIPWWAVDGVIEKAQRRGSLKVGLDLFEPWTMCDVDGELIGFEVEVAEKLAADMGLEVAFVRTDWEDMIPALIDDAFDVIISGMSITAARNLRINFTDPVRESGLSIVANRQRAADLTTLEDFNRSRVTFVVRSGTTPQTFIEKTFPRARVLPVKTEDELVRAITRGRAHAAVAAEPVPAQLVNAHPDTLYLPFDQLFEKRPEAFAIRKGDPDGLSFFNSWIALHRANGWLDERNAYWFKTRTWEDRVSTDSRVVARCLAARPRWQ